MRGRDVKKRGGGGEKLKKLELLKIKKEILRKIL